MPSSTCKSRLKRRVTTRWFRLNSGVPTPSRERGRSQKRSPGLGENQ
jgi:hypothetical protein